MEARKRRKCSSGRRRNTSDSQRPSWINRCPIPVSCSRHVFGLVAIPLVFPRLADLAVHRLDVGLNTHLFEPGVVFFAFITRISNQTFWQLAGFSWKCSSKGSRMSVSERSENSPVVTINSPSTPSRRLYPGLNCPFFM